MNKVVQRSVFILLAVVICSAISLSQEGLPPEDEFPAGIFIYVDSTNTAMYDTFNVMGMNYQGAEFNDLSHMSPSKLMGTKDHSTNAYITKYTRGGYYTRWEAERDTFALLATGVKHVYNQQGYIYGHPEPYNGAMCWASDSNIADTIKKFQFGPNYKQDKKYYWWEFSDDPINYIVNFRMGLTGGGAYPDTTVVCTLRVLYTWSYLQDNIRYYDSVQLGTPRELKVSDFAVNSLDTFLLTYNYQGSLFNTKDGSIPDSVDIGRTIKEDDIASTGIEFIIDYNGIGKLYVDYVEVYDDRVWYIYMQNPTYVANQVKSFCDIYKDWPNLRYWLAYEEPNTIDAYTPYRIVDSIVQSHTNKSLITMIYTNWTGYLNGDDHLQKYVEMAKPKRLMIDWFPFWPDYSAERGFLHSLAHCHLSPRRNN